MGRIYKDIGFGGLWNGLPVRIVMIGTLTGLQWMIYVNFLILYTYTTTNNIIGLFQDLHGLPYHWWSCTTASKELDLWLNLITWLQRTGDCDMAQLGGSIPLLYQ